ncbi:hypothetical protein DPMN_160016 [Dreissena polymorpha]|uniref:Uncharacterized protein n=1 Tax=Dreissena polymorpha TaxID=45954 RepID=A0A9D4IPQ1_DREPO|nr:hypothetical protein DPMN_160016 [Dreissena polymorpha]
MYIEVAVAVLVIGSVQSETETVGQTRVRLKKLLYDTEVLSFVTHCAVTHGHQTLEWLLWGQSTVFLENPQADNHWSAKHPQNKAFSHNLKIYSSNIQCSSSTA